MKYTVGIDIGTTSIKMVIMQEDGEFCEFRAIHNAETSPGIQDVAKIVAVFRTTLELVYQKISEYAIQDNLSMAGGYDFGDRGHFELRGVAVCSQMHGVLTWNHEDLIKNRASARTSPLYTWEYPGGEEEFYQRIKTVNPRVFRGYGCATLAYLEREGLLDEKHDRAGTIGDFIVSLLHVESHTGKFAMSDQMAVSFGFCDGEKWGIPDEFKGRWTKLLATSIVRPDFFTGTTDLLGLLPKAAEKVPLSMALGDLQCTMYHSLRNEREMVLNLGTSSQIAWKSDKENDKYRAWETVVLRDRPSSCVLPFFNHDTLFVTASMNGGNMVMAHAKELIAQSGRELNTEEERKTAIDDLMRGADECAERLMKKEALPKVEATGLLWDERDGRRKAKKIEVKLADTEDQSAEITPQLSLLAACGAMISNLFDMTPIDGEFYDQLILMGQAAEKRYLYNIRQKKNPEVSVATAQEKHDSAAHGAARYMMEHKMFTYGPGPIDV